MDPAQSSISFNREKERKTMKKMIWILIVVTLITVVPMQGLACGWEFVSPIQHSYNGRNFSLHTFRGNVCTQCGFIRASQSDYNNEALVLVLRNKDIENNSCWVMYDSAIYAAPDAYSRNFGWVEFGENFHVGQVEVTGGDVWIQLKERADSSAPVVGWIKAENIYIDPYDHPLLGNNAEIGRTIEITASSGRGRMDAGTEYPYIETVHFKERYTVLDTKIGTNGNGWYKINVDGNEVWISSGLTKFVR
jgi:hypothetical protein